MAKEVSERRKRAIEAGLDDRGLFGLGLGLELGDRNAAAAEPPINNDPNIDININVDLDDITDPDFDAVAAAMVTAEEEYDADINIRNAIDADIANGNDLNEANTDTHPNKITAFCYEDPNDSDANISREDSKRNRNIDAGISHILGINRDDRRANAMANADDDSIHIHNHINATHNDHNINNINQIIHNRHNNPNHNNLNIDSIDNNIIPNNQHHTLNDHINQQERDEILNDPAGFLERNQNHRNMAINFPPADPNPDPRQNPNNNIPNNNGNHDDDPWGWIQNQLELNNANDQMLDHIDAMANIANRNMQPLDVHGEPMALDEAAVLLEREMQLLQDRGVLYVMDHNSSISFKYVVMLICFITIDVCMYSVFECILSLENVFEID
jgi:hypothetical protein